MLVQVLPVNLIGGTDVNVVVVVDALVVAFNSADSVWIFWLPLQKALCKQNKNPHLQQTINSLHFLNETSFFVTFSEDSLFLLIGATKFHRKAKPLNETLVT